MLLRVKDTENNKKKHGSKGEKLIIGNACKLFKTVITTYIKACVNGWQTKVKEVLRRATNDKKIWRHDRVRREGTRHIEVGRNASWAVSDTNDHTLGFSTFSS